MGIQIGFEAHDHPLRDVLFSNLKYRVPRYQRPYSWSEDQVSEFWNDLSLSDEPYFFGSFIFNKDTIKETGFVEVIDGQQRLLTVTILTAVLRDLAKGIDSKTSELIQRQDIGIEDRDGYQSYRIECGDSAKQFFMNYIQSYNEKISYAIPKTPEEERIKGNYEFFHSKVENELNRIEINEEKLSYLKYLRNKLSSLIVIKIDIDGEENAYEIFETTNARGVDLSIADLLKNLIFRKIQAQDDRDFAKEIWSDIVQNIHETGTELKRFIRYFWISKYQLVTEKHLFREIKRNVTNWQALLEDLWSASEWYNKLIEGSKEDWRDIKSGNKIIKSITALKLMGVSQCYVLLLSILRNYDKLGTDPTRIFQLIEKFTFNYSAICKLPANKVERLYSNYARRIEETVNNEHPKRIPVKIQALFVQLEKDLQEERPSFEFFYKRLREIEYGASQRSRQLVKYILSEINSLGQTGETIIDFDNVNIEHILPQSPNKKWGLTKKEIKPYVNKIGNLTLVSKKFNSKVGNKIVREKIDEYAKSEIAMTNNLVDRIKALDCIWGEEQINRRLEEVANLAYYKVWVF